MPSATDELRKMLDERGVEYRIDGDWSTEWESSTGDYSSGVDCGDGKLIFTGCLTPTQATEVTLGRGTCHDIGPAAVFKCSVCGWCSPVFTFGEGMPEYCACCGREVVDG